MCAFCIPVPPGARRPVYPARPELRREPRRAALLSRRSTFKRSDVQTFFVFNHFRTAVRDRNALNSFRFMHLRTTFFATEGWGRSAFSTSHQSRVSSHFVSLCFQQLPATKFCNSFPLITIQDARGGYRGSSENHQHTNWPPAHPSSTLFVFMHLHTAQFATLLF